MSSFRCVQVKGEQHLIKLGWIERKISIFFFLARAGKVSHLPPPKRERMMTRNVYKMNSTNNYLTFRNKYPIDLVYTYTECYKTAQTNLHHQISDMKIKKYSTSEMRQKSSIKKFSNSFFFLRSCPKNNYRI